VECQLRRREGKVEAEGLKLTKDLVRLPEPKSYTVRMHKTLVRFRSLLSHPETEKKEVGRSRGREAGWELKSSEGALTKFEGR